MAEPEEGSFKTGADCAPRIYKLVDNISSTNRGCRTFGRGTSRLQDSDCETKMLSFNQLPASSRMRRRFSSS